jgi:hypothetical protein
MTLEQRNESGDFTSLCPPPLGLRTEKPHVTTLREAFFSDRFDGQKESTQALMYAPERRSIPRLICSERT